MTTTTDTEWITSRHAATRAKRNPVTVRRALAAGELHGHQPLRNGRPVPGSTWRIAPAAVDAWVRGADEHAQRQACGCLTVRAVRRPA